MLDTLITSKTRLKILLKFFLNERTTSYLRDLESEFGESTNSIRVELNRFEKAGLLSSNVQGNKKVFQANRKHPLFSDIKSILMKNIGIDQLLDRVIRRLGGLQKAYITGSFAKGNDSRVIDVLLVGSDINGEYLLRKVNQVEDMINRKIRYLLVSPSESEQILKEHSEALLVFEVPEKLKH